MVPALLFEEGMYPKYNIAPWQTNFHDKNQANDHTMKEN